MLLILNILIYSDVTYSKYTYTVIHRPFVFVFCVNNLLLNALKPCISGSLNWLHIDTSFRSRTRFINWNTRNFQWCRTPELLNEIWNRRFCIVNFLIWVLADYLIKRPECLFVYFRLAWEFQFWVEAACVKYEINKAFRINILFCNLSKPKDTHVLMDSPWKNYF